MYKAIFTSLLLVLLQSIQAQIFQEWTFNTVADPLEGWVSDSLPDAGGTVQATWDWTFDGTARDLFYWNNRPSIGSDSKGGAIVMNSSNLFDEFGVDTPHVGTIISPEFSCSGRTNVHLKFNNYYRNFESLTQIEVLEGQDVLASIPVNNTVNKNVESGHRDYTVLNLSPYVDNAPSVSLRFRFEGSYYFWIVDDVEVWEGEPYEDTNPPRYGDSLRLMGIKYKVDSLGGAYRVRDSIIGDEIVCYPEMAVQFDEMASEATKDSLRQKYAATRVDSCMCNKLELWTFGDYFIVGDDTLSASGLSNGIEEKTESASSDTEIEGAGANYFVYTQLKNSPLMPLDLLQEFGVKNDSMIIAVLDTGVDFYYSNIQPKWTNVLGEIPFDGIDNDGSCYPDDIGGWNFIDKNNNALDNHSHGTHVAGIIVQNLANNSCGYSILPVKTHDARGIGDIFGSTCAIYYAAKQDAKIINCSWGYYGTPSTILYNSIEAAKFSDILVVASAGNDTVDVDLQKHYPSNYALENILAVTAYDNTELDVILAPFANYSSTGFEVDIADAGVDISSYLYGSGTGLVLKSGTSMAAPAVTASAALANCSGEIGYQAMIDRVLLCAGQSPFLLGATELGQYNTHNSPCLITWLEEEDEIGQLELFPNPTSQLLTINYQGKPIKGIQITIYNALGQQVYQKIPAQLSNGDLLEIPVEKWASGWYMLYLQGEKQVESYKFIVIR